MAIPGNDPISLPLRTLFWGVLGAVICGTMIPLEPNMLEEGLILEAAQRMVRGDRLYQDVVAFTGPLPFELLALLFRIFGEEIFVARVTVALLHGCATASIFAIARRSRSDGYENLAAGLAAFTPILLFPLFSTYFYTTLAVTIGMLAGWTALLGLRDSRWLILSGMLISASALCKQTIGAVLAVGLFLTVVACASDKARLRTGLSLIAGSAFAALITLAAYWIADGLDALIYSLVELPMAFQTSYESPFMNFWPPGQFSEDIIGSQAFYLPYFFSLKYGVWVRPGWFLRLFTQILYALPFIAVIATLVRRRNGPLSPTIWIHLAVLVAVISNLFPRSDWGHLVSVLPNTAIQLVLVLPIRKPTRAASVILGALALVSLIVGGWLYSISEAPTFGPRVPLRPINPGYRDAAVPRAINYLLDHTEPGDAIFVARAEPLIYFATDTINPTPYGGVIPGMVEEQQRVIPIALENTRYVVMSDIDQPVFTYYRDELPKVQFYLERHFHVPDDFLGEGANWLVVLERGIDRGPTHLDLIENLSDLRPWVRLPDGRRKWAHLMRDVIATAQNRRFLPIILGGGGGGIDFDVDVPENAVFQASVGYPAATGAKAAYPHHPGSRMILSIREDGEFRRLKTATVNPKPDEIPQWVPFEVDLSEFAGRSVTLRLHLLSAWPIGPGSVGWFGSPRIAIKADTIESQ